MLRVKGIAELGAEEIRIGPYSFEVEWPESLGQPVYWRAGLVSASLLEIGIHYRSGRLKSISLPLAKRISGWPDKRLELMAIGLPKHIGAPVFYVEPDWISNPDVMFIDSLDDVLLFVGWDRIALDLGNYEDVKTCSHSGRVSFGIDQDGFLHTIEVGNLAAEEMSNLKQHFQFPK